MPATIQFVDSIAASPTVRLDINDGATWFCTDFSAPPPRLRRSESSNAMRDGGIVGSSSYENRTLSLALTLVNTTTEDAAATELQKLWRELDRPSNYLRYQREGMSKPVFFKVFRSDVSELEELWTTPVARNITVELLAEPFALGLRETLGPYTVNNDPAAASNGLYFDATGIKGDVATEPMLWWTGSTNEAWITASHGTAAIPAKFMEAEAANRTNDTTNIGGAADATMSGSGTTNFVRTSFATVSTMAQRVTFPFLVDRGAWRVLVCIRRSSATGVIKIQPKVALYSTAKTYPAVTTALSTSRRLLDLGVVSSWDSVSNVSGTSNSQTAMGLQLHAERISGTSTLDWDYVILFPVGGQVNETSDPRTLIVSANQAPLLIDSPNHLAARWSATGDPSLGTSLVTPDAVSSTGAHPTLTPDSVNRIHFAWTSNAGHVKSETFTVNGAYWPRYLHVRPVSS